MRLAQIAWNTRQQSTVDAKLMMISHAHSCIGGCSNARKVY
jgi:hypothetical protein